MEDSNTAGARVVRFETYLDEGDAARDLEHWLDGLAPRAGVGGDIERYGLRFRGPGKETAMPAGGIVNLWGNYGLMGQATLVRTPLNRTVLTIVEYPCKCREEPGGAGMAEWLAESLGDSGR